MYPRVIIQPTVTHLETCIQAGETLQEWECGLVSSTKLCIPNVLGLEPQNPFQSIYITPIFPTFIYQGIFLSMLTLLYEFQVQKGFQFFTTNGFFQMSILVLFISFFYLQFLSKLHLNTKTGKRRHCFVTGLNQTHQTQLDSDGTPVNYSAVSMKKILGRRVM